MNPFEALSYAVSMYIPFSTLIHVFLLSLGPGPACTGLLCSLSLNFLLKGHSTDSLALRIVSVCSQDFDTSRLIMP